MPLEIGQFIGDLDSSWPLGGDPINKGDDHLRLIKSVLQIQFPGSGGSGFTKAILATEDDLNYSQGLTDNIQTQLDALDVRVSQNEADIGDLQSTLPAPAGTRMVFNQAAPPTGWTIDATITDHMMRVVDGTTLVGGAVGGTDNPVLNNKVPTHTHTTVANGNHTHTYTSMWNGSVNNLTPSGTSDPASVSPSPRNYSTVAAGSHTHTINANAGASNWTPRFVNMIVGVKD